MNGNDIHDIKPPMVIPNGWEWLWITLIPTSTSFRTALD